MTTLDLLIGKQEEKAVTNARINFFLQNKDKMYNNCKENPAKFEIKLDLIEKQKEELAKKLDELARRNKEHQPPVTRRKLDIRSQIKELQETYPELSDPRCFTHVMRKVPLKHLKLLYNNSEKRGTRNYLNERFKTPPEKKYYFPETTYFRYGWKMTGLPKGCSTDKQYGCVFALNNSVWRSNGLSMFQQEKQIPFTCIAPIVCSFRNL